MYYKLLLILQHIPIVQNVFGHTHKQFHQMLLSHVMVADPDSSDPSRRYPNEHYRPDRYGPI
jgi:hypothetical protein